MAASEHLTTRLSTKGQITLPKEILSRRNWRAGTHLTVEETEAGVLIKAASQFEPTAIDQVFGMLHRPGQRARTIEEMDAGIMSEARRRARD